MREDLSSFASFSRDATFAKKKANLRSSSHHMGHRKSQTSQKEAAPQTQQEKIKSIIDGYFKEKVKDKDSDGITL